MTDLDSEIQDVALSLTMLHFSRSNAEFAAKVVKLLGFRKSLFGGARRNFEVRAEMSILFCAITITQANLLLDEACAKKLIDMFLSKSRFLVFQELERNRADFKDEYSKKIGYYFNALRGGMGSQPTSLAFIRNVGGKLDAERQMQIIDLASNISASITSTIERLQADSAQAPEEYESYHEAIDEIVAKLEAAFIYEGQDGNKHTVNGSGAFCELIAYSVVRHVRDLYGKQVNKLAWNSFRHSMEIRLCSLAGDSAFNDTCEVHEDGSMSFISRATPWLSRLTEIDSLIEARSQRGPLDARFALASVGIDGGHFSAESLNRIDEILYEAESAAQSFILPDIITCFS